MKLEFNSNGEDKGSIEIDFKNDSRTFLRPSGSLTIRTEGGKAIMEKKIGEFLVLPGHHRPLTKNFSLPNPGKYSATVILDFGAEERVGARIFFNRN